MRGIRPCWLVTSHLAPCFINIFRIGPKCLEAEALRSITWRGLSPFPFSALASASYSSSFSTSAGSDRIAIQSCRAVEPLFKRRFTSQPVFKINSRHFFSSSANVTSLMLPISLFLLSVSQKVVKSLFGEGVSDVEGRSRRSCMI